MKTSTGSQYTGALTAGMQSRKPVAFSGGRTTMAKALLDYSKKGENAKILSAYAKMGASIPMSFGLLLPGPGWLLAGAGYLLYRSGEKKLRGIDHSKATGPLARSADVREMWKNPVKGKEGTFVDTINEMINQTFRDEGPIKNAKNLRRAFRLGGRRENLTKLAYQTNAHYAGTLRGKIIKQGPRMIGRLGPLKGIGIGIYGLVLGAMMMTARGKVGKEAVESAGEAAIKAAT